MTENALAHSQDDYATSFLTLCGLNAYDEPYVTWTTDEISCPVCRRMRVFRGNPSLAGIRPAGGRAEVLSR